MEDSNTRALTTIDEATIQNLDKIEVPYSEDDWDKIEVLLTNRKPSKGKLNRINIAVNPEVVSGVSILKRFSLSNIVLGSVIITAIIVLLFRFFDDTVSDGPKAQELQVNSVQDEDIVRGVDTLKTITQHAIKVDSIKDIAAKTVLPVKPSIIIEKKPEVIVEKPEVKTVSPVPVKPIMQTVSIKSQLKTIPEKTPAKVKMEVEEIDAAVPSPTSLIKRKKVKETDTSAPNSAADTPPEQVIPQVTTNKPSIQGTSNSFEDTQKELRKRKNQQPVINNEQRPKAFRELDSIR
jgi:hypothetical protein